MTDRPTSAPTCGDCGAPMRQTFAYLTTATGCERVPTGLDCTSQACRDQQRALDLADQDARDEAAIERAIAQGVITR